MLACKLQYPDMQSAVEADLQQLQWLLAIRRRLDTAIDTTEIAKEIGARVREELDYRREAKHVALYRAMLDGIGNVRVPRAWPEVSSGRLLTLDWLDGTRMLAHKTDPLAARNALATKLDPNTGTIVEYRLPKEARDPHTPVFDQGAAYGSPCRGRT